MDPPFIFDGVLITSYQYRNKYAMFLYLTLPGDDPVIINTNNVTSITPYEEKFTVIFFNYLEKNGSTANTVVKESFHEVKEMMIKV